MANDTASTAKKNDVKSRQAHKMASRKRQEELKKINEELQKTMKEKDIQGQELVDLKDKLSSNEIELAGIDSMDLDSNEPTNEEAPQVQASTDTEGPEEPKAAARNGPEGGKEDENAKEQGDPMPIKTELNDDQLFVPVLSKTTHDTAGHSASAAVDIDARAPNLETLMLDQEDDLIKRGKVTGFIEDDKCELLRTRKVGLGTQLLLKYGFRNAALYKWVPSNYMPDYPANTPSIMADRLGEEKNPETGKYKYGLNSVVSLQGVAIYHDPNNFENKNCEWWETLDPVFQEDEKKKKERAYGLGHKKARVCYPTTHIKVKWRLDGEEKYSWETRSTVRRLWGRNNNRLADEDIYKAAQLNQSRYDQVKLGTRPAEDRSASPEGVIKAPGRGLTPQIREAAPNINKNALRAFYCLAANIDEDNLDEGDEAKIDEYEKRFFS